jgi:hypothetical protein
VSTTGVALLGIIALATLVMALVQVGAIVFVGRLARRVDALADKVEQEVKPLLSNLAQVAEDAARSSSLAAAQIERADQLFANLVQRADETFTLVQAAIITPAREGRALLSGVRAAIMAFRELRAERARRSRFEEEDPLFIG